MKASGATATASPSPSAAARDAKRVLRVAFFWDKDPLEMSSPVNAVGWVRSRVSKIKIFGSHIKREGCIAI